MMITVNLYYKGSNGNARAFAEEMESSGIAADIRAEKGNLRYQYFQPIDDPETILLIDSWTDQAAIDAHHASPMMAGLNVPIHTNSFSLTLFTSSAYKQVKGYKQIPETEKKNKR